MRRRSNRTVLEESLFIGSATNPNISIEEIRFTDEALEVLLLFNEIDQDLQWKPAFTGFRLCTIYS
ncbi:MAG: hypothetical protein RIC57_08465 [Balneola sp.]